MKPTLSSALCLARAAVAAPVRLYRAARDRLGFRPTFERWLERRTRIDRTTGETVTALWADYAEWMRRRGVEPCGDFRSRFNDLGHPVITDLAGRTIVGRISLRHAPFPPPRGQRQVQIGTFVVPGAR